MNRLQQIEERLAAIGREVETRGEGLTAEELTAHETEVAALREERTALIAANERRAGLLGSIAEGNTSAQTVRSFQPTPAAQDGSETRASGEGDPLSTVEYRTAFMRHVLRGTPIPAEFRADANTLTTDVGAVIPTTVLNTIVDKMEAVGMVLPLVTRTNYKGGVSIPTSSVKPVASWVSEGQGSDKQKKTTGTVTFTYFKLRCAVSVSLEVDTMAVSAFEAVIISNITEAMTKAIENAIINGTGTGQPKGILAEEVPTARVVNSSAPSYTDLTNAEAALLQAYENDAVWFMSKKTFMAYFGLQDETGQPIGRVNYGTAGKPERVLLGRPVVVCDYVTSYTSGMATGTAFAFLFNPKDYVLNTNYNMGLKKYEDNDTEDQVTKAVMVVDGKVIDAGSLVEIKKAAAT